MRHAQARPDPAGAHRSDILATPGAVANAMRAPVFYTTYVQLDPHDGQAQDQVLNAAAANDPLEQARVLRAYGTTHQFANVRDGLYIGSTAVLLLIGASLLVSMLEQLRDRKKLLSALVAFGTRRTTLSWSVLWQTTVPVMLGLALATGIGRSPAALPQQRAHRAMPVEVTPR